MTEKKTPEKNRTDPVSLKIMIISIDKVLGCIPVRCRITEGSIVGQRNNNRLTGWNRAAWPRWETAHKQSKKRIDKKDLNKKNHF